MIPELKVAADYEPVEVEIDRGVLIQALRNDCVTTLAFYIGEELTLEVPDFHIEIWDELLQYVEKANDPGFIIGKLQKLFCVPREHAKSTLAKLAVILFFRFSRISFAVYASNTRAVSIAACRDIVKWLESEQEAALFGKPTQYKSNESEALWIYEIGMPDGSRKKVFLKALGADSQVRGTLIDSKRPELMIFDDCEDLNTARSESAQSAFDEWFLGSALKAVAKRAVVIVLGNLLRGTTMTARLAKDKTWNPTVFGCIVRDRVTKELRPLWPSRHTLEALLADYAFYRSVGKGHVWAHEMMNLTAESVFGMSLDKMVTIPRPNQDMISEGAIVLDPAFGENAWNDFSSLTVHVKLKSQFAIPGKHALGQLPFVVQSVTRRMDTDSVLDEIISLTSYWGIRTVFIETVAAQRLLIPYFRSTMKLRGLNPDALLFLPITGGKKSKSARILSFKASVANGSYGIAEEEGDLIEKLIEYDPTKEIDHDDLEDSAAYGVIIWSESGEVINAQGIVNIAMSLSMEGDSQATLSELDICNL